MVFMAEQRPTPPPAPLLVVEDLWVETEGKSILKGIDLTVNSGELHAIMGPNGSGKSTLANVLLGNPSYDVTLLASDARAKLGMFLAIQYPEEISGVPLS